MLRSLHEIEGYRIAATDAELGKIKDYYFDDSEWIVRYLVVDTGGWLSGRRVLISPLSTTEPDWIARRIPTILTKQQVENSPVITEEKPVSRQEEESLARYYRWDFYWATGPGFTGAQAPPPVPYTPLSSESREQNDPHLRSVKEVIGYHIEARDGEIGHVHDFIAETGNWRIRYLVLDTRNWLPGRKVIIPPTWIQNITWAKKQVRVNLSREQIQGSPEFDPAAPVNREYEARLYDYYGRPKYWETP